MYDSIVKSLKPLDPEAAMPHGRRRPPFGDHDLNRAPLGEPSLTPAAVLVPLVERAEGLTILLTQRTDHLHDHAGQISFPGGRMEPSDTGPVATALRETREEIGLAQPFIEVVGLLDDYETVTGFRVTPVVSFVSEGFELELDSFEVAEAFEVPLAFILDERNHQVHSRMRHGEERHYYVFEYGERYIWGATAGMLMNLFKRMGQMGTVPNR